MAAPSNIRINPFIGDGGTTNYVNFIEKHIVPAVSPFVIRLNEVPEKQDPKCNRRANGSYFDRSCCNTGCG